MATTTKSASSLVNISEYNLGKWVSSKVNQVKGMASSSTSSSTSMFNNIQTPSLNSSEYSEWYSMAGRIAAYLFAIVFVIILISLFITPIIKLRPGDPGLFYLPIREDGVLFWEKGKANDIENKELPISELTYDYSLFVDVFIQDPNTFSRNIRMILSRGADYKPTPPSSTIPTELLQHYNFMVGLMPDTNDMIVSVLNKDSNSENVMIHNIPIQEPFRLGIVIMQNTLEVYINGKLVKTRTFVSPPKDIKGNMAGGIGKDVMVAKLRNLKVWPRILKTSEIRESPPRLSTREEMSPSDAPATSNGTCA
jgi:hypothetical protein